MDDQLFAAIADYLRRHRRPPGRAGEEAILRIWQERHGAPRCRVCGAPVDDDGGLFDLADLRARRACHLHYAPF